MLKDSNKIQIYAANFCVVKDIIKRLNEVLAETERDAQLAETDAGKVEIIRDGVFELSEEADNLKKVMDYVFDLKSL